MTDTNCPGKPQLIDYARGVLSDEAASALEEHLGQCTGCSRTMTEIETLADDFTTLLRQTHEESDAAWLQETRYAEMLEGLSELKVGPDSPSPTLIIKTARGSANANEPMVGRQLGQYKLLAIVGEGGMGLVYKALHVRLGKVVALKVLSAGRVHEPRMHERFQREMHAAGQIEHPNVVQALDASEADGHHFLIMDLVDGVDLSALLRVHGPFSVGNACEMIRMAAVGLEHIHLAGMIHRDMKPANLMLARDGQVRILDLGLALLNPRYSTSVKELTLTGQLIGTIDYMAPEQADNTHAIDARADIFGLGATLFALLCGKAPLGGRNLTLMKKLSLLANEPAPSIQEFCPDVADPVAGIISKMLARNPDERFASAAEVALALTPFCDATGLVDILQECRAKLAEVLALEIDVDREQDTALLNGPERSENASMTSVMTTASTSHPFALGRLNGILLCIGVVLVLVASFWPSPPRPVATKGDTPPKVDHSAIVDVTPDVVADITPKVGEVGVSPIELTPADPGPTVQPSRSLEFLQHLAADSEDASSASDENSPWVIFSSGADPDLRADAIHQACRVIQADRMLQHLLTEESSSIRAGLALALSEYDRDKVWNAAPATEVTSPEHPASVDLLNRLLHAYVNDPDPEYHAAVDFLLRSWGQRDRLEQVRPLLEQKPVPTDGGWYQPLQMSTMVVIPGPRTEKLGSPADEPGRFTAIQQNEDLHTLTIPYSYAICSREVTQGQYWRSRSRYWATPPPGEPDRPVSELRWEQAAEYCNRLSLLEGLSESDLCYESFTASSGIRWRQKKNALELTGYRLPTGDEWEIACRAGTVTSRPFGDEKEWLTKYAVAHGDMVKPLDVGSRKPNSFGLFDMLGNVAEWMYFSAERPTAAKDLRHIRGGSVWTPRESLRSAARFYYGYNESSGKIGFRVARTIQKRPLQSTEAADILSRVEIQVGPRSCPEAMEPFADSGFQPLLDNQIVEFGKWIVGSAPLRHFRIQNTSDQSLKLSALPWMNGAFVFDPPPPLEIPAHAAVDFGVRIPNARVGEHTHDLQFFWEGLSEFAFPAIRLHGCIEGPFPEVYTIGRFGDEPGTVSLGAVPLGSTLGKRFFMRNIGDQSVEAAVTVVTGPFTLAQPLKGKLLPQKMDKSFRITLDTATVGTAEGVVTLKTARQPSMEYSFNIRANIVDSKTISSIGVFRDGTWLIDKNWDTVPDETIQFGSRGDRPLTGDWNGDGICDLAVWHRTAEGGITVQFYLRGGSPDSFPAIQLESDRWTPVAADLDGDGRSEIGYVMTQVPGEGLVWVFDTRHDATFAERFVFGSPGGTPVIGDWNGDGVDQVAVCLVGNGANSDVRLWQLQVPGDAEPTERIYLSSFDIPLAGDWDGNGIDDLGGWRPVQNPGPCFWQFETTKNEHSECDLEGFGVETDIPFVLR